MNWMKVIDIVVVLDRYGNQMRKQKRRKMNRIHREYKREDDYMVSGKRMI